MGYRKALLDIGELIEAYHLAYSRMNIEHALSIIKAAQSDPDTLATYGGRCSIQHTGKQKISGGKRGKSRTLYTCKLHGYD